jgi:formate dehydrogenase subunit gamma
MQNAEFVHGVVAMRFIAAMLGHIYIGPDRHGRRLRGDGRGTVDINWAKEHHGLWLEEEGARSRTDSSQPQPTAAPGE